jgi:hypothetical protein
MSAFEFAATIVCDDVRKEVTNKEILIGVYSGDIVVPSFPAWLPIAFWIEANAKEVGHQEVDFRLTVLDNKPPMLIKAGVRVNKLGPLSITISGIQILLEKEGVILLEVKEGENWKALKSKDVIFGTISADSPIPRLKQNIKDTPADS